MTLDREVSGTPPAAGRWSATSLATAKAGVEGRTDQRGSAPDGPHPRESEGQPKSVFDGLQAQLAANRSEFYRALASGPFYNFDHPDVKSSEAVIENWWRQGMMGDALSHYDGIVAFAQTDFTEDSRRSPFQPW
jgi:hypothetical protein